MKAGFLAITEKELMRQVPGLLSRQGVEDLLGRVKANRTGLREVLVDRRDPDLEAVRSEAKEGGAA